MDNGRERYDPNKWLYEHENADTQQTEYDEQPEIPASPLNLIAFLVSLLISFGLFGMVGLVVLPFVMAIVYAMFWNPFLAIGALVIIGLVQLFVFLAWFLPLVITHIQNAIAYRLSHLTLPAPTDLHSLWQAVIKIARYSLFAVGLIVAVVLAYHIVRWMLKAKIIQYALITAALFVAVLGAIYGFYAGVTFLNEYISVSEKPVKHPIAVSLDKTVSKVVKYADPGASPIPPPVKHTDKQQGFIWPVRGKITSHFGYRIHPIWGVKSFHTGIDIAASYGTPIRAAAPGRVVLAKYLKGYGYTVIIRHDNGLYTLYAHMSRIAVRVGQRVKRGQVIGYVGSTGWSTGPHLHFSIYRVESGHRAYINPEDVLKK